MDFEILRSDFNDGDYSAVQQLSQREAREIFRNLKATDYFLAVEFMEQYNFYRYTGRMMVA